MKIENKNFTEEELLNLAELQFVKYNFPNVNVSDHINHDNKLIISLNKEIDESIISNFLSIKFAVPIINQIIGHSQQHKEWENKNNLFPLNYCFDKKINIQKDEDFIKLKFREIIKKTDLGLIIEFDNIHEIFYYREMQKEELIILFNMKMRQLLMKMEQKPFLCQSK